MHFTNDIPFSVMQDSLYYTYIAFSIFGFILIVAILLLVKTLLTPLIVNLKEKEVDPQSASPKEQDQGKQDGRNFNFTLEK